MKKLCRLIICLFILPMFVLAGGGSDDAVTTSEVFLTCTYDDVTLKVSPSDSIQFKMIVYKDSNGKYLLENYNYMDGKYYKMSGNNAYFTMKNSDASYQFYLNGINADSVVNTYNSIKECPYVYTDLNNQTAMSIGITNSLELNGMQGYAVSKGSTTLANSTNGNSNNNGNSTGNSGNSTTPQITHKCIYTLSMGSINNVDSMEFEFYMKDNGKKYWTARLVGENETATNEQLLTGQSTVLNMDTNSGRSYSITLSAEEIENIFKANNIHDIDRGVFNCPSDDNIGLVEEPFSEGIYHISTDVNEIREYASVGLGSFLGVGAYVPDTLRPDLDNLAPITDCESLLGSPNTKPSGSTPGSPAYYMMFVFNIIKYIAIILLVTLSIVDFVKAVAAKDDDSIKKASNTTIKRLILCVIVFLLPTLIEVLLEYVHTSAIDTCGIK